MVEHGLGELFAGSLVGGVFVGAEAAEPDDCAGLFNETKPLFERFGADIHDCFIILNIVDIAGAVGDFGSVFLGDDGIFRQVDAATDYAGFGK